MAISNQLRQVAFKKRMRDAGCRQITVWANPDQQQAIKALVSDEGNALQSQRERLAAWESRLAEQESQLVAREERADAQWQTHDALVLEVGKLRQQLDAARRQSKAMPSQGLKVVEPSDRRATIFEAMRTGGSAEEKTVDSLKLQSELAGKFCTDIKGTRSRLLGLAQTTTGEKLVEAKGGIFGSYIRFSAPIVSDSEKAVLQEACALLRRIDKDVERAGRDIGKLHEQRDAERKARLAQADAALSGTLFSGMAQRGEILFLAAQKTGRRGYGGWADLLDKLDGKKDGRSETALSNFQKALAEEKESLIRRIADTMASTGQSAAELVAGIVEKYNHPDTEERYGELTDKILVFLVAEQIEATAKH